MAGNRTLGKAKAAKNDEFYTQLADIEREVNAYLAFDHDTFLGKSVLLPCDDPNGATSPDTSPRTFRGSA